MRRSQNGMIKAVSGVVLVGGALAAIFYWNSSARRGPATATANPPGVTASPATPAPQAPLPTEVTLTTPLKITPVGAVALNPSPGTPSTPGATGQPAVASVPVVVTPGQAVVPATPTPISASSPEVLQKGKQLFDSHQLVEARTLVNSALLANTFTTPGEREAAKLLLRQINDILVFSPHTDPNDPYSAAVVVKPGDRLTRLQNEYLIPWDLILKVNNLPDARRIRAGQSLKVVKGPLHAVVSKSAFTLDLYFNSPGGPDAVYVTTFRVGLGTNDSTPTGLWRVTPENKLKNPTYHSPRGEGVIAANDPANPLGEYWIGLTGVEGNAVGKLSYGIHGTIHPESIGKMESMGCIRLLNEDVGQVFLLLFEGKSLVRVVE